MKRVISLITILVSCSGQDFRVESHLKDPRLRDEVLFQIVRHTSKLPDNVPEDNRFLPKMDSAHLAFQANRQYRYEAYFVKNDTHYFMVSRIAPSLFEKRICIAGKFRLQDNGQLLDFEEVFRTFKMVEEERKRKSDSLFRFMVEGRDLSPYYFHNTNGQEYIEFPDRNNRYDKKLKRWIFEYKSSQP